MTMDHAAIFLASSILVMLAAIVWVVAVLVVNNLIHRYWKPLRIFTEDSWHFNPPEKAYRLPEDSEEKKKPSK